MGARRERNREALFGDKAMTDRPPPLSAAELADRIDPRKLVANFSRDKAVGVSVNVDIAIAASDHLRRSAPPAEGLAAEFERLAEKATQGPMRSMRDGNQYLDGLHSKDGKSLVGASRVEGLARPWNRGGAALFIDLEHVSRFRDEDADFIAFCFNHRTAILRWAKSTQEARNAALEEAAAEISEQIANQRNIVKSITDREEKRIENARIVGMGDALIAVRALKGDPK